MKDAFKESDVAGLVGQLLADAVRYGASDIHFEPTNKNMIVRFRLDGELKVIETLPKFLSDNVVSRLKVLGDLLTYRNDIPQEGRIQADLEATSDSADSVTDKRLAIFPTIHGQRAVVRLFYENTGLCQLDQLGFSNCIYESLKEIASQNQGILLLTGPAGSGKSTTLGAVMRHILKHYPGKSIVSLEDPVERQIEGVTQVQISPHGAMTFPVALRSLLRQDPEVLMIGEIRDADTARIAIEAGLTGHLLMTTMHSGSPAGALLRLLEMRIEPYQVTSSVSAVLNQRLVRKLCDQCKEKDIESGTFKAVGCEHCFQTGFRGRVLIAEMIKIDGQIRKCILDRTDLDEMESILKNRGHMNMLQDGHRLASQGITTNEEITKVCPAG